MRVLYLLIFYVFLTSCTAVKERYPAGDDKVIDIVFDLDWTLFSQVDSVQIDDPRYIKLGNEIYRANDFAIELLTYLTNKQGVRISFYSGGPEVRNFKLLAKVKLLDGTNRSLLDIAHKVVSRNEMVEVDVSHMIRPAMADRFRKDLLKIKGSLDNLLMVEDDIRHALNKKQKKHIAWLGKSFYHYEDYSQVIPHTGDQFVPSDKLQWVFQRNKLGILAGVIDEALEGGKDFNDEVTRSLEKINFSRNLFNSYAETYLDRGVKVLERINDNTNKIPLDKDCFTSVSLLIHTI